MIRTQRWSVAITRTMSTRPITTFTSCFFRYAVGSAPVRSSRWLVADQTSRLPRVTSARTAISRIQSTRGVRSTSVPLLVTGRRQDAAVLHEDREPGRGRGPGDRGLRGVDGHAVDAVERLPDLADRGAGGAGTRARLADHHDHDVVLVVRRDPRRRLLPVDLGRPGLPADVHPVEWEPAELPGQGADLRRALQRGGDVVDAGRRGVDLADRLGVEALEHRAVGA